MVWQNEKQEKKDDDINNIMRQLVEHSKKITEAVYRITDMFSSKEPLKWGLREEGMKIFKLFISLDNRTPVKEKIDLVSNIEIKIDKIVCLLEIASSNSFITGINFNILKREYLRLKSIVLESQSLYLECEGILDIQDSLTSNFLTDNFEKKENNIDLNKMSIRNPIGQSEIIKDINKENDYNNMSFKMSIKKDELEFNGYNSYSNENESRNKENNTFDTNMHNNLKLNDYNDYKDDFKKIDKKRLTKILDIIKSKEDGFISINEVFRHFNGVSKKTIQRDLLDLVHGGILKMDGEKRWRKYMLTNV